MFKINPILKADSYKYSHPFQFPKGTTNTYYNIEPRKGGRYPEMPFFGNQGFMRDNISGVFCKKDDVEYAKARLAQHGEPFHYEGWMRIVTQHNGHLPIRIKAIKEGTIIPEGVIPVTVESLDPQLPWLPGWIETMLLRGNWYPTTVAARSYACKKIIYKYLLETDDNPLAELSFRLHDFGQRGASSCETAAIGGAAHLINFKGTDTLEGLEWMAHHYGDGADGIPGFSIAAMEHSTVLVQGKDNEAQAYANMLEQFLKPGSIVACVSDTYDYFNTVENIWCGSLKEKVMNSGGIVVIRPDSALSPLTPADVIRKTCDIIDAKIGCTRNDKGYKLLPSYFRVIQGDGNDDETSIESILSELKKHKYSASNVAYGMGGGLLQKLDRDTQRFAMKLSEATVDGEVRSVCKTPKTDPTKTSRAGRFSTVMENGKPVTISGENQPGDMFDVVYEYGNVLRTQTIDEVRSIAGKEFV